MYRVYAQAFFIITTLLVIFIFFKPEERFSFLDKFDIYLFLMAALLFASFPVVLAVRYLFKAKKLVFQVKIKGASEVFKFLKSRAVKLTSNVFGFLLVLLVCALFLGFFMFSFGKFISRPFFDALTKFFVRNTVQETLSEMDFYTKRSLGQADIDQLKSSVDRFENYVRDKEYLAFLEKGAQSEISKPLGTDASGNEVALAFYLSRTWDSTEGDFTDFFYTVFQKVSAQPSISEDGSLLGYEAQIAGFKIRSTEGPKLNFEVFAVPNETGLGVMVVWWKSEDLNRYVIFGPTGGREKGLAGAWVIGCLEGCEHEMYCEERPTFDVSENEVTGETEYIIKTGEYSGAHLINYDYSGYAVTVNELGGLDIERLEFRR